MLLIIRRYGGAGDSRHEARAYLCDLCEIAVAVDFPHSLGFSGLAGRDRRRYILKIKIQMKHRQILSNKFKLYRII